MCFYYFVENDYLFGQRSEVLVAQLNFSPQGLDFHNRRS